ncbi:uncharacterized protein LOC106012879 [Aplysia californica]|uniref:Uncharacterized protein LOC106012879 n=1 Tax=Aplysia californica TaxID=6500 RepID=A0ABM1A7W4_APLCA|nr:uncharacterized protein LOC106012879 [Aplysia californica]
MLGCLLFAQTVVTICAYIDRTPFDSTVKEMLKESLLEWTGIDGEDGNSLGWNAIMSYFRCCGVDNFSDAAASPVWAKTIDFVDQSANLVTPFICCTVKSDAPNCATSTGNAYLTQTYFNRGCYQPMWDYITSHTGLIITVVFLIFLFEFLCLFFAVWNICGWKSKEGTSQVNAAYHTDDYHNADYRNDPYRNAGPRSSDFRNTDYRTKDHRIDDYRKADYRSADNRHDNYRNGDYRTEDYRNADYRQKDHGRYPN